MRSSVFKKSLLFAGQTARDLTERGFARDEALRAVAHGLLRHWPTSRLQGSDRHSPEEFFAGSAGSFGLAWCESAFSIVSPSDTLAASLMATRVHPDTIDLDLQLPWRCFGIEIPRGLVSDVDGFVLFLKSKQNIFTWFGTDGHMLLLGLDSKFNRIATADLRLKSDSGFPDDMIDRVERIHLVLGRLLVNLCLELSYKPDLVVERQFFSKKYNNRRLKGEPTARCYLFSRPVNIDVRKAISDFVQRGGSSPRVQCLVRGHYKLQPCGESRSERKLIHIEPYWRGPENAPIALRKHVLEDTGQ